MGVVKLGSAGEAVHVYPLGLPVTDKVVELPTQTAVLLLTVKLGPTTTFPIDAVVGVGNALSVTETVYVPGGTPANTPVALLRVTGPVIL